MTKKQDPPWELDPALDNLKVVYSKNDKGELKVLKYTDTDLLLGFAIFTGCGDIPVVQPIYQATLRMSPAGGNDANVNYTFYSCEVGENILGSDYTKDPDGIVIGSIVSMALAHLQTRLKTVQDLREKKHQSYIKTTGRIAARLGIRTPKRAKPKKKA